MYIPQQVRYWITDNFVGQTSMSGNPNTKPGSGSKHKLPEYYDNIYFDSDSDEEGTHEGKHPLN